MFNLWKRIPKVMWMRCIELITMRMRNKTMQGRIQEHWLSNHLKKISHPITTIHRWPKMDTWNYCNCWHKKYSVSMRKTEYIRRMLVRRLKKHWLSTTTWPAPIKKENLLSIINWLNMRFFTSKIPLKCDKCSQLFDSFLFCVLS